MTDIFDLDADKAVNRGGRLVEVVTCTECVHGDPDEMGDGTPGVCCDIWFYHDSPRGRQRCWPINSLDHFCAKGERKVQTRENPTAEAMGREPSGDSGGLE